jgi:GntR family transcriptional regulator of vanillate catabolism
MAAERDVGENRLSIIKGLLADLDACFGSVGEPADFDNYSELNGAFHAELAELCDSVIIQRELDRVRSLPFASPSAFVLGRPDIAASHRSLILAQEQHRALVAAIENREGSRAEWIAREHARIARANLEWSRESDAVPASNVLGLGLIVS